MCDCGSPQVGAEPNFISLFHHLNIPLSDTCAILCCRNVMILAAIPERVAQGTVLSAPKENAAVARANSRHMAQDAAAPVGSVTLKSTAVESPQSAQ